MNELRFTTRRLLKSPGFTVVAVLTLALGVGANLAVFGILNELLLRPRPVAEPDELFAINAADENGQPTYANMCWPYYEAFREYRGPFKSVIGYAGINPRLRTSEGSERIRFLGSALDGVGRFLMRAETSRGLTRFV